MGNIKSYILWRYPIQVSSGAQSYGYIIWRALWVYTMGKHIRKIYTMGSYILWGTVPIVYKLVHRVVGIYYGEFPYILWAKLCLLMTYTSKPMLSTLYVYVLQTKYTYNQTVRIRETECSLRWTYTYTNVRIRRIQLYVYTVLST